MQLQPLHGRLLVPAGRTSSVIMLLGEDVTPLQHEQPGAAAFPSLPLWHRAHVSLLPFLLITSCNVTQTAE